MKWSAAALGSMYWALPRAEGSGHPRSSSLKAFIVSDAHMGWDGKDQPSLDEQRAAMATILKRFPDLDLLIDTGDAHHGNAKRPSWGDWMEVIPGGCGVKPFFYTTGNHEQGWGSHNAETHVARLGSLTCRPYYSYDLKGIHFVSVPQLMRVNYVSEETLSWLDLDLAVHRDRTTIFLSHNELRGTTEYFDSVAYRQIANSEAVFSLIEANPQVVAWCHGHNHTYEIIRKDDVFYVSNGRIGGFSPPGHWVKAYGGKSFGRGHLGGILLEVSASVLSVRGFSASLNKFLSDLSEDEIGPAGGRVDQLSQSREMKTSFDPGEPAAISYGVGGALSGTEALSSRHYILDEKKGSRSLFVAKCRDATVNENADFSAYTVKSGQFGPWIAAWDIRGTYVSGGTDGIRNEESKEEPGIILEPSEEDQVLASPDGAMGRSGYYRCPVGRSYQLRVMARTEALILGVSVEAEGFVDLEKARENPRVFHLASQAFEVSPSGEALVWGFVIPDWAVLCPGASLKKPSFLLLGFSLRFPPHQAPIRIEKILLTLTADDSGSREATLEEDGVLYDITRGLARRDLCAISLDQAQRQASTYRISDQGVGKVSWLVREEGLQWQVRNAAVSLEEGRLVIGPFRCDYSPLEEVIIVPFGNPGPAFVHRLRHVGSARLDPKPVHGAIEVAVDALGSTDAEIDIFGPPPSSVTGAELIKGTEGISTLILRKPGTVVVSWK